MFTPDDDSPVASLAWARAHAERIGGDRGYAAMQLVPHWGSLIVPPSPDPYGRKPVDEVLRLLRPPSVRIPGMRSRAGAGPGTRGDATSETAPERWAPSTDGGDGDRTGGGHAPSTSATPARPSASPAVVGQAGAHQPNDAERRGEGTESHLLSGSGAHYSEWDHITERYRERAVTVHSAEAKLGDPAWAVGVFHEHAVLIRRVRQRFERLRSSRLRSGQQLDGDELDIPACVRAAVDRHMGQAPDDRLYMTAREARHPLAILLLADVSGSTSTVIAEPMRMIDIEKVALLIASEALSSLGDRYALLTFSGRGARGVRVTTLKGFDESLGERVRHRIAALNPGGFTRMGAAVRHATAALVRESARHRLLLILSDGRPNDVNEYVAEYGVEDSRQAVAEARARGVYPFCLNVDDEGSEYLARIFGPAGYTSLRRPDQLPLGLLQAVRTLIRS
jgi:nitric oxide reductase NorD protein